MSESFNVTHEVRGSKLVIEVDIGEDTIKKSGRSSTGKSLLVASTKGFIKINNRIGLSLNVSAK